MGNTQADRQTDRQTAATLVRMRRPLMTAFARKAPRARGCVTDDFNLLMRNTVPLNLKVCLSPPYFLKWTAIYIYNGATVMNSILEIH